MAHSRKSAKLASPCAIGSLLELLTRPWTLHILWALSNDGPMRFGVLRRRVEGISSRVLTERLRTLEDARFIFRHYEPTIPPAVTYGITDRMKDIQKVLHQLEELSRKWQGEGKPLATGRTPVSPAASPMAHI
ncbi:MAG TPA: helix-turn-helix domain-containing protein [Candidatus Deferrimicrobiaceae bacterium]|jgi:DNA-binding HxlR family transcriptional regulator|nr:helix-turn-helix domain-containing protein [Candidatus Deferrimicrobiaceae bacterium]